MSKSKGFWIIAGTQLVLAYTSTRRWLETGGGEDLFWTLLSWFLTILCGVIAYRARNSPPWPKSASRSLQKIALMGLATGIPALVALLWRTHGDWVRLGEPANLVLAILVIFGLGYGGFAALMLREQRES